MPIDVYGIGGYKSVQAGPLSGFNPPGPTFKGQLGQQYFDKSTTPPTEYIYNGQTWVVGGVNAASSSTPGIVVLSTNAQAVTGTDATTAVTPAALNARLASAAPVGPGASPQISNSKVGQVIFSGVSIAAAAVQSFTVTNSTVAVGNVILANIYGCTTGAALTIQSVTAGAGSFAIVVANGTGATTTTANITVTFEVLA